MMKLKRVSNSGEDSLRRLAFGLSVLALAAGLGAGSYPARAQNDAPVSTTGEFQLAEHTGVPVYQPFFQPYYQPSYRARYRPRRRPHRHTRRKKADKPVAQTKWYPAEESKDPVQIIISLPEQKITVYKGDKPLVSSRVSSGKPGYNTPSGVFSILQKNRHHRSNIYSGAPMPFMQRLTWSGIALHGSNAVPKDNPASHGCIRLPQAFAGQLFGFTEKGAHVIVANEKAEPTDIIHDKLFQPAPLPRDDFAMRNPEFIMLRNRLKADITKPVRSPIRILVTRRKGPERIKLVQEMLNELAFGAGDVDGYMGPDTWQAIRRFQKTYGLRADGIVSDELIEMLYKVTGKGKPTNGHLYVRRDFKPVFDAPVVIRGGEQPLGAHLYTAMHFDPDATRTRWLALTLTKGSGINAIEKRSRKKKRKPVEVAVIVHDAPIVSTAQEALERIDIPQAVRLRINQMLTPGSSLAITNTGLSKETTPKGTDFIVLMQ